MSKEKTRQAILFLSAYPPRECGIGTFTKDLVDALEKRLDGKIDLRIAALNNDETATYNYERKVSYQITDDDIPGYIELAKQINEDNDIKLINIQHEFGIFGGHYGDNLLAFLEVIKKPIVLTFHTIIPNPSKRLYNIVNIISKKVSAIVVITKKGEEILRKDYGLTSKIKVIAHGIPYVGFESQEKAKMEKKYSDKIILSSFGLISSNKGYEEVIKGLPQVIEKFPNLLYLIVGKTHPEVVKREGEKYRNSLITLIKQLNLQRHVKFYNNFLTLDEIINYLKMTDIYISSSTTPEQISSGTLAYAMGCGRAVISTPFYYAQDNLSPQTGILTEFNNPASFSEAIIKLLSDEKLRKEMEENAYSYTRKMTWDNVALQYADLFDEHMNLKKYYFEIIPPININHLQNITDSFGIIQFSKYSFPDIESGYTLDDNARALIVALKLFKRSKRKRFLKLMNIYLDFIKYSDKNGILYNYVDKNKKIDFKNWSSDAHGRAIWALGYLICEQPAKNISEEAEKVFLNSIKKINLLKPPKSMAYSLIGLHYYYEHKKSKKIKKIIETLANKLLRLYEKNSNKQWIWFEKKMSYDSSRLSEALFYAYLVSKKKTYLNTAIKTLDFLISNTVENGTLIPIGQNGWFVEYSPKSAYDQQPIEAAGMTETLKLAHSLTKNNRYKDYSRNSFKWFLGKNIKNQLMYNEYTGGCYDGLKALSVNTNEGAESTLSYLLARLSLGRA